jgi:hypothetical protein
MINYQSITYYRVTLYLLSMEFFLSRLAQLSENKVNGNNTLETIF